MPVRRIKAFERGTLRVGRGGFESRDLEALARYEERTRLGVFDIGWNRVDIGNHVGVFASGDLVLEILPKAEREDARNSPGLVRKWSVALLRMLAVAYDLRLEESGTVGRSTAEGSLLDIFARHYLDLVEILLRGGLAKGYRRTRERVPGLRGKFVPDGSSREALVHRERLLCEFDVFDLATPHNRILARAVQALRSAPVAPATLERATRLAESLPEETGFSVREAIFETLAWTRRTEAYRPAVNLARLILLGLAPEQRQGEENTLSLLFGMNELFESYVGTLVRRAARRRGGDAELQPPRRFWERRTVRPDIVVSLGGCKIVLDTKWKVLQSPYPSVEDVRQMYVYNRYFDAARSYLVYPQVYGLPDREGRYRVPDGDLRCGLMFISLFEGDILDGTIGDKVLERIGRNESCDPVPHAMLHPGAAV